MNIRGWAIGVLLGLLALFSVLNWPALTATSALTLGFTEVNAPLGLILLLVTVLVSALFVVYIVFQQAAIILETRRFAREMKEQRDLVERAEASRFMELKGAFESEVRRIEALIGAANHEIGVRFEHLEQGFLARLAEADRTTSSYLGEIEDKLDRVLPVSNKDTGA